MARLCIRILANTHPTNPALNTKRTQVGDIVCVVEDGHVFSNGELGCGHYRFIHITDGTQAELIHLIASSFNADGTLNRLRAVGLNVTVLNTIWAGRTTATKAEVAAITVTK